MVWRHRVMMHMVNMGTLVRVMSTMSAGRMMQRPPRMGQMPTHTSHD